MVSAEYAVDEKADGREFNAKTGGVTFWNPLARSLGEREKRVC